MFQVNIEKYQGPFDLILDLITKKKIEICEIKVIDIITEYLNYVDETDLDEDIQGDFLLVASRLLELKSRYLLSINTDEETEDMDKLICSLEQYKLYKGLAEVLRLREEFYGDLYSRKANEQYVSEVMSIEKLTISSLEVNASLMLQRTNTESVAIHSKKNISVEEKINEIENKLKNKAIIHFREIAKLTEKDDSIAAMLSILEMAKIEKVGLIQYNLFNDIIIEGK